MLGHAFILVGNGDSSCNVRDYGSYAGGETWCAVYINSNAMLERHLPKQLLDLVDKARDLLPEHQSYRQEQQREKGHSWGDMSL